MNQTSDTLTESDKRKNTIDDAKYAFENAPRQRVNVGEPERWISTTGGAGLILYGLKTRGMLGLALGALGAGLIYRGTTGHCSGYSSLGISTAEDDRTQAVLDGKNSIKVEESIFIAADQVTLYEFWRKLSNLPQVMSHLKSVTDTGGNRSHWVAKAPMGTEVEWDAEIITNQDNELIAWKSLAGSEIPNAGSVRFKKDRTGAGTEVRVNLMYHPPVGKLGGYIAKLFGEEPGIQIKKDLQRLKRMAEAGELNGSALR